MNPIAKMLISTPIAEEKESGQEQELKGLFDEPEDDSNAEGEEAAAEELLDAFHSKDVHAFRSSLKAFINIVRNS